MTALSFSYLFSSLFVLYACTIFSVFYISFGHTSSAFLLPLYPLLLYFVVISNHLFFTFVSFWHLPSFCIVFLSSFSSVFLNLFCILFLHLSLFSFELLYNNPDIISHMLHAHMRYVHTYTLLKGLSHEIFGPVFWAVWMWTACGFLILMMLLWF
jgi:hypothetical protein